jgi:hypothetical protein
MSLLLLIGQSEISTPVIVSAVSAWNTRAAATQTQTTAWNTRAAATQTQAIAWRVRMTISLFGLPDQSIPSVWNVRSAVPTKTVVTAWNVRTTVPTKTQVTAWNVLTPPIGVFVTTITAWHVRSTLSKGTPLAWHVRTPVSTKTAVTAWNIRTTVPTKLVASAWSIRQALSLSIDSEWGQYEYERDRLTYTFQPVQPSRVQYQHSFERREAVR